MSEFRAKRAQFNPAKLRNPGVKSTPLTGPEKRRGVRVNSQVPVALEWNLGGTASRGEAHTRVVGPYGCLGVSRQGLDVDQQIQVTNLVRADSPARAWLSGGETSALKAGNWGSN